jgi:hypothetical protein
MKIFHSVPITLSQKKAHPGSLPVQREDWGWKRAKAMAKREYK